MVGWDNVHALWSHVNGAWDWHILNCAQLANSE